MAENTQQFGASDTREITGRFKRAQATIEQPGCSSQVLKRARSYIAALHVMQLPDAVRVTFMETLHLLHGNSPFDLCLKRRQLVLTKLEAIRKALEQTVERDTDSAPAPTQSRRAVPRVFTPR